MSAEVTARPLGELVDLARNGLSVSNRNGVGGIPISRIETISEHEVNPARVGYAGIAPGERDTWLLMPGDILFSHINSVAHLGKCAQYKGDPPQLIHGMNLLLLRPKRSVVDPRYLLRALRSSQFRKQLEKHIKPAVNQASVSISALCTLSVLLPPLPEQRRIADILDRADAVRRKRKQAIALTEELLRSTFLEMFGDPVNNPKGWPTRPLEAHIDERGISYGVVQRGEHVDEGVPVVRISNFGDNRFDGSSVVKTSRAISDAYRRTVLRGGELVVSIRGTVGRIAIVPSSACGWNVSREVAVVPLLGDVSRPFVHRALLTEGAQRFMLGNVKGVAQSGINLADLRQTPIPVPSPSEITRFERAAERIASLEGGLRASWERSEALFSSLVHRAFRGELTASSPARGQLDLWPSASSQAPRSGRASP